jgi:hypothetical protein
MPISHPPSGKLDTLKDKPGSVGVPVAASTVIVDPHTLRPLPYGHKGEIAISGPTVMKSYLDDPQANRNSYFHLTLDISNDNYYGKKFSKGWYFLTGDIGTIDREGFLTLKGRNKELIKKGGEQVSPFEVEEAILEHPWIKTLVCFSVPSKIYGEEVGCAVVLSSVAPANVDIGKLTSEIRSWLTNRGLNVYKWPTKWKVVKDSELPKTKTNKYIRNGLFKVLKMESDTSLHVDRDTINGLRYYLSCCVMFMHIGSVESWGSFANLRGIPWHTHVFFLLGGYSTALAMNPIIVAKMKFLAARVRAMYPMYFLALIFGLVNLLINCRPSTFRDTFHWVAQPYDLLNENGENAESFCEGAPAMPNSYWLSLFTTIVLYTSGAAVTPFWPLSWFLGYYLWFISIYYQCLAVYPTIYNRFFRVRRHKAILLKILITLMILSYIIIFSPWFIVRNALRYVPMTDQDDISPDTIEKEAVLKYNDSMNTWLLHYYLFGPFWMVYFIMGICLAFIYDAYRPAENSHYVWRWGGVADLCTLTIIAISITAILQGTLEEEDDTWFLRPSEADNDKLDNTLIVRLWDTTVGRILCPLTTLWVYALSTGQGYTARLLRGKFVNAYLSPNAYNCFLFHQMVSQWYYAVTREGRWWTYWGYRKRFYWFSPEACPVEWYEFPLVVLLTTFFSHVMNIFLMPIMSDLFYKLKNFILRQSDEGDLEMNDIVDVEVMICTIIEDVTGIRPNMDWTLEECGLASIGLPVIVANLNEAFSSRERRVSITTETLISAETIGDLVHMVKLTQDDAKSMSISISQSVVF